MPANIFIETEETTPNDNSDVNWLTMTDPVQMWMFTLSSFPQSGYLRSDSSGVRTSTVTLTVSDWPMVSVTVSWNLYTPEVKFDTTIWSSKLVFCEVM